MARPDQQERQHRRWLEDAQKYLARGALESALPLLLRLPGAAAGRGAPSGRCPLPVEPCGSNTAAESGGC